MTARAFAGWRLLLGAAAALAVAGARRLRPPAAAAHPALAARVSGQAGDALRRRSAGGSLSAAHVRLARGGRRRLRSAGRGLRLQLKAPSAPLAVAGWSLPRSSPRAAARARRRLRHHPRRLLSRGLDAGDPAGGRDRQGSPRRLRRQRALPAGRHHLGLGRRRRGGRHTSSPSCATRSASASARTGTGRASRSATSTARSRTTGRTRFVGLGGAALLGRHRHASPVSAGSASTQVVVARPHAPPAPRPSADSLPAGLLLRRPVVHPGLSPAALAQLADDRLPRRLPGQPLSVGARTSATRSSPTSAPAPRRRRSRWPTTSPSRGPALQLTTATTRLLSRQLRRPIRGGLTSSRGASTRR